MGVRIIPGAPPTPREVLESLPLVLGSVETILNALAGWDYVIVPREPTQEMLINGARSIGSTMRTENHIERSRDCWDAFIDAIDGNVHPKP